MFELNIMTGIRLAKSFRMLNQISFDLWFASRNFSYSKVCEFKSLIKADPRMLSFMTLFSQSIVSWDDLNSLRTFENTKEKVIPITGTIIRTAMASFQSISKRRMLAQIIRKTDDIMEVMA